MSHETGTYTVSRGDCTATIDISTSLQYPYVVADAIFNREESAATPEEAFALACGQVAEFLGGKGLPFPTM